MPSTRAATSRTTRSRPQPTQPVTTKPLPRKPRTNNKPNENDLEHVPKLHSKSSSQKVAKPIDLSAITDREPIMVRVGFTFASMFKYIFHRHTLGYAPDSMKMISRLYHT